MTSQQEISRRWLVPLTSVLVAGILHIATDLRAQQTATADVSENSASPVNSRDWPWWRGPTRDGIAAGGQSVPLQWGETTNVRWKVAVPGRSHGSPIVVGDRVVISAADPKQDTQSVLCFDRRTGGRMWTAVVHRGGLGTKGNAKTSLASATLASDGERFFVNFLNGDAVQASAIDHDGKILWQTKVCDFVVHQGYGASPAIYGPLVLVSADHKGGGTLAALDRQSGKIVWTRSRPAKANYTSPTVLTVNGRDQLLFAGCDLVTSLDPLTGQALWEIDGSTTECVTSMVTDGQRVFVSGGYPRNHLAAVRADGSGKIDWENNSRVYVPSMIVHDGYLYAMLDAGIAVCWEAASGREAWRERLGGTFSSSLVLVDGNLLATDESGLTVVFRASPDRFQKVAENRLGDECMATPAVCGNCIFHRVARHESNGRQEWLYCLARP